MFRVGNFIRLGKTYGESDKTLNVNVKGKNEGKRKANNQNSIKKQWVGSRSVSELLKGTTLSQSQALLLE